MQHGDGKKTASWKPLAKARQKWLEIALPKKAIDHIIRPVRTVTQSLSKYFVAVFSTIRELS
jgi:hypothetical protein